MTQGAQYPSWAVVGQEVVCLRDKPWSVFFGALPDDPKFMRQYKITGLRRSPKLKKPGIMLAGCSMSYHVVWFEPVQKIEQKNEKRIKEPVS